MPDDLADACPRCSSPPGRPCINTSTGKPFTGYIHRERRQAGQRRDWRQAVTAAGKAARNRRGKPITGVVKQPPD